ncbi:hypothetical protein H5087_08255 [Pseudoalteromonas sp. SR43-7]|uniref:hypothetical protein n=1 Tax=Pseudoalteromonas sp. SR43-7 TaxID=2760939 RepID=UPI0015FD434B|nr:hypothetical protein [Pseudoalteromonas sp. SR43-7]MBB1329345.1 hypothetical protein [Pseudoalteromonas sp. SR43-7]
MNKLKDFFFNRSNWFYFKIICYIFILGFIAGISTPQISFIISLKNQSLPDWIIAFCTIGIFVIAMKTKGQWLKQKDLENHTEFSKSFYQYYLLKASTVKDTNKENKIRQELEHIETIRKKLNVDGLTQTQLTLDNKERELELFKKNREHFYLEIDQAKEKMLVMASIIRVNREDIKSYAMALAAYNMYDIANDFDKFRREINEIYLDIQRVYFSESELIHLPE